MGGGGGGGGGVKREGSRPMWGGWWWWWVDKLKRTHVFSKFCHNYISEAVKNGSESF